MKTLKQVLKEAGQTAGTPGSGGNWSMSGPDLAKQWGNPGMKSKLTSHQRTNSTDLLKRIADMLSVTALAGMSEQELDILGRHAAQVIDTSIFKAKKQAKQDKEDDGDATNAKPGSQQSFDTPKPGQPRRTGTQILPKPEK